MTCEYCSDEARSVVRHHNKTLRTVVRKLRGSLETLQNNSDETFAALCEGTTAAEQAMRELWASGEFDCGPEDYGYIVERTLYLLRAGR